MAVRWRADPPIQDPVSITRERAKAWVAAVAAATVAVTFALRGFEVPLPEALHSLLVGSAAVSCLAVGRGVYASVLARMDLAQIRRTGRSDLVVDAVVCALAAIGCAVLAIFGDRWFWLGCVLFMTVAVDQARFLWAGRVS